MLYIDSSVHEIFQLILANILKFCPDVLYQDSGFNQAFLQEDYKCNLSRKLQILATIF